MRPLLATVLSAFATMALAGELPPFERFSDEVEAAYPNTPTLDVHSFLTMRNRASVVIVDVREPAERAVSTIPGAISLTELRQRGPDSTRQVLVYCTIGMRSAAVTRQLREEGLSAFNLRGGVLAWAAADQPFVDGADAPTKRVHVYGRRWSYLPIGFEPVW